MGALGSVYTTRNALNAKGTESSNLRSVPVG